jgi:hypothetical protein
MTRSKRNEGSVGLCWPPTTWPAIILVLIVLVLGTWSPTGMPSPYSLIQLAGETCALGASLAACHHGHKRSPRKIRIR